MVYIFPSVADIDFIVSRFILDGSFVDIILGDLNKLFTGSLFVGNDLGTSVLDLRRVLVTVPVGFVIVLLSNKNIVDVSLHLFIIQSILYTYICYHLNSDLRFKYLLISSPISSSITLLTNIPFLTISSLNPNNITI